MPATAVAAFPGDRIELTLTDGDVGDDDGLADGAGSVDPGGIAEVLEVVGTALTARDDEIRVVEDSPINVRSADQ